MMFRALTIGLLAWPCLAATEPLREVTSQAALVGNQPVPAFYNGYIYWVDDPGNNYVRLYAPDGHLALATGMQQQKPGPVWTQSVAVDSDGTIAISWVYGKEGGGTAQIDFLDGNGRLTSSIATGTYVPAHITFDSSHNIWSFGYDTGFEWGSRKSPDYLTLRKYSRDGKQLGAWLPRSSFPAGLPPAEQTWQSRCITVTSDRVGLLAYSGKSGSHQEWVEAGLDGNLIGRWDVDATGGASVALTNDGHAYLQQATATNHTQLFVLDRVASKWTPVTSPLKGQLAGADGADLVFFPWGQGPIHLYWFPQPQN
jgi:hypothetical protein